MQRVTGWCRHAASRGQGRQHWAAHVVVLGCTVATSAPPRSGRRSPLPLYVFSNALHPTASLSAAVLQHAIIVFQWTNNILVYVSIHRSRGLRLFSECWRHLYFFLTCWHHLGIRWEWRKLGLIMSCGHWELGTIFTLACQCQRWCRCGKAWWRWS